MIADKISECAGSEWRALLEKVKLTQETPGWLRYWWEGRQRLSDASRRSETKSSSVPGGGGERGGRLTEDCCVSIRGPCGMASGTEHEDVFEDDNCVLGIVTFNFIGWSC